MMKVEQQASPSAGQARTRPPRAMRAGEASGPEAWPSGDAADRAKLARTRLASPPPPAWPRVFPGL